MASRTDQTPRVSRKAVLPDALKVLQLPNPPPLLSDVVSPQSALPLPKSTQSDDPRSSSAQDPGSDLVATPKRSARPWEGRSPLIPSLPPTFYYYEQEQAVQGRKRKRTELDLDPESSERQRIAAKGFTAVAANMSATRGTSGGASTRVAVTNNCRICDDTGDIMWVVCTGCSHPYLCSDCAPDFVKRTITATGDGCDFSLACPEGQKGHPHQLTRDWEHLAFLASPGTLETLHNWRWHAIDDWKRKSEYQLACAHPRCDNFFESEPTYTPAQVTLMLCNKCGLKTCSTCEMLESTHDKDGFCHTMDQDTKATLSETTQACPRCRQRYEREHGCNHMTCKCGMEFCYLCGAAYVPRDPLRTALKKNCACPLKEDTIDLDGEDGEEHRPMRQAVSHSRRLLPSTQLRDLSTVGLKGATAMIDCVKHKMGAGQATRRFCNGCLQNRDTFACASCRGRLCLQCFTMQERELVDLTDED